VKTERGIDEFAFPDSFADAPKVMTRNRCLANKHSVNHTIAPEETSCRPATGAMPVRPRRWDDRNERAVRVCALPGGQKHGEGYSSGEDQATIAGAAIPGRRLRVTPQFTKA